MAKNVKIYEIAKAIGIASAELVEICQKAGYAHITHHSKAVPPDEANEIRKTAIKLYKPKKAPVRKAKPKAAAAKKAKEPARPKKEEIPSTTHVKPVLPPRPRGTRQAAVAQEEAEPAIEEKKPARRPRKRPAKAQPAEEITKRTIIFKQPKRQMATKRVEKVELMRPVTVRELSEQIGVPANQIIRELMFDHGVRANINATLEDEVVELIGVAHEVEITLQEPKSLEDDLLESQAEDSPEDLEARPPVVALLGHVDHGKTSILDRIRNTHVAESEPGGITQDIGAWQTQSDGHTLTFIDTPGHEAFTAMRARGARITDLVVLVVAADDGVMPQTEEAINHARAAEVPIVVAINKCDLPQASPERVKQQLTQYELLTEEWGGQTICIETSAVTGQNVDQLLESLLLEAEMIELKANADRPAIGTVIEAELTEGFGPMATFLVQNGTLEAGNVVLAGTACGKIRAMTDENRKRMRRAGPTVPVRVAGLSSVPEAGDRFYVFDDLSLAKQLAGQQYRARREAVLAEHRRPRTLEAVFEQMTAHEVKELPIIIKADVQGSVEAVRENLEKIEHPEVRVRVIHMAVGGVNESDVLLADASDAIIIAFNAVPDQAARLLAEARGVDIRRYSIIYNVTDDVRKALEGLLAPLEEERHIGEAEVIQTFKISRVGTIAGCRMTDGAINRNANLRIIRDGLVVHTGRIESLKRFKDDVREARSGQECGIRLAGYNDIKVGDRIEAYEVVSVARTL
ncbi:MAG: translation initiation factor IF-2 [Candidatus Brocadiae bacterium]|nr:translation initiation factor IF-2 [Candidatus Brocadiia bacterium]